MDAAFNDVGKAVGTEAWRIEAMKPVKLEFTGKLYSGDSYIFLHTKKKGLVPPSLLLCVVMHRLMLLLFCMCSNNFVHDIFFWLGKDTSQDEAGVAAFKTVELDEGLGGGPVQYREVSENR